MIFNKTQYTIYNNKICIYIQYLLETYWIYHFNLTWFFFRFYSESFRASTNQHFFQHFNMIQCIICCMFVIKRDVIICVYWEALPAAACRVNRRHYESGARAAKICIITRIRRVITGKVRCNQGWQMCNCILETSRSVRISWRSASLVGALGE